MKLIGPRPHRDGRPTALVLGGGGIEVVRALGFAGIPCCVVAPRNDAARFSRHVTQVFNWDWTAPLEEHDERLADRLVRYGQSGLAPPVLFYCWDESMIFVSRYREQLRQAFRFVVPHASLVESLADKELFRSLAEKHALPVPPTRVLVPGEDGSPPDTSPLNWPIVVKPTRRDRRWNAVESAGAAKAIRIDTSEELHRLWPDLAVAGPIIGQQYIGGPESRVESYHVYVSESGEIVGEFTGRKIRTLPLANGYTTALVITNEADVIELGRSLVRRLDLRGVAKFDFKRTQDGKLYLFEINARFNLWHHPGARAGVNIPALVYADLTGDRSQTARIQPIRPVEWFHPKDFLAARRSGMPVFAWANWAVRCEAKAFWAWNDVGPSFGMAASLIVHRNNHRGL